jgi:hypothetical protein
MSKPRLSRRELAALSVGGAVAAGLLAASTKPAQAYQGNMERALSSLYEALASLREATPNKGGHREKAMKLIQDAIAETGAGIEFADQNGGQ